MRNSNQNFKRRSTLKGGALLATYGLFSKNNVASAFVLSPVVETTHGKVQGTTKNGVYTFKGIRYGETTGGSNRFLPPIAVTPWAGVKDAVVYGNSAPQLEVPLDRNSGWVNRIQRMSEDCLFLNVFTPGLSTGRRPVMVWLHGGLWADGSGDSPGFNGKYLAHDGDVVLVSINHRLNVFGYLQLESNDPRFSDSANVGVLDMVQALTWVRDNIAQFGGDPNNVTIFGQSGGAAKVAALMGMPASKGLFHKAIIESCSGGIRIDTISSAAEKTHTVLTRLGMHGASASALQSVPMEDLLAVFNTMGTPGPRSTAYNDPRYDRLAQYKVVPDPVFRPVLNHISFFAHPFDPVASPLSANIPLLMGNANTEMTLFMAPNQHNFSLSATELQMRLARFFKIDTAETVDLINKYRTVYPSATPTDLMITMTTDYCYKRNTMRAEDLQSMQAPVYGYVFDWAIPTGELRSPHTIEIPFAFGTTAAASDMIGTGPDLPQLVRQTMGAWVAFARTGDPNNSALPHWPRYDPNQRLTMMLDLSSHVLSDPGVNARQAFNSFPYYDFSMPRSFLHA